MRCLWRRSNGKRLRTALRAGRRRGRKRLPTSEPDAAPSPEPGTPTFQPNGDGRKTRESPGRPRRSEPQSSPAAHAPEKKRFLHREIPFPRAGVASLLFPTEDGAHDCGRSPLPVRQRLSDRQANPAVLFCFFAGFPRPWIFAGIRVVFATEIRSARPRQETRFSVRQRLSDRQANPAVLFASSLDSPTCGFPPDSALFSRQKMERTTAAEARFPSASAFLIVRRTPP